MNALDNLIIALVGVACVGRVFRDSPNGEAKAGRFVLCAAVAAAPAVQRLQRVPRAKSASVTKPKRNRYVSQLPCSGVSSCGGFSLCPTGVSL